MNFRRHKTSRGASATAHLIAASTVFVSRSAGTGHFVPPRAAELCAQFVAARTPLARRLFSSMSAGRLRPLGAALERLTLPGIQLHYALRKRLLEEVALGALGAGLRQVVVLGAGFDTLALRLSESHPAARFVEVDHPATQTVKRRVVEGRGLAGANLRFAALDLASLGDDATLGGEFFDARAPALFVAEGVLMYLAPDAVGRVFNFLRRQGAAGSLFAFTFMETRGDGRCAFRGESALVDAWLRLRGEPFRWGVSRAGLGEFLGARAFSLREVFDSEALRGRYLSGELARLPLAEGECVCVAELV
jgi:methyltransferase (TIGR00027 family)